MPVTPNDNPLQVSEAIAEKVRNGRSADEVAQIFRDAYVEQGLATNNDYDPSIYTPTTRSEQPTPTRYAKTITVDNVKHLIESDSEQGLVQREIEFYRSLQQPTPTRTEVARDADTGRFTTERAQGRADENLVAKAELELKFKRGEIDTATFLAQSGAIENYLEQQGIPLDTLKEVAQERQDTRIVQSWQEATQEFLNSPEGRTWPGGQENLKRAGELIQQMGATDVEDKVLTLVKVYRYMRENELLSPNKEADALRRVAEARTPSELRDAAVALRGGNSTIWGG
jgi:hypothetical protein